MSVIIPAYNEVRRIGGVLDDVLAQDYPSDRLEIIVVDGASTDGTGRILEERSRLEPRILVLRNEVSVVPVSLNMAIRAAQGERIVRMDAHTGYPKEYISTLINWQDRLGVENVGCAVETRVEREDDVGQAIELALSSRMGVGDSAFRVGTGDVRDVDTVPFGCYRREVFDRIGLFDERLIRNQDIEFNRRLRAAGGRVVLIPGLRCTYYGPSSLKSLAVKSYQNGFWNLRTVAFTRNWGAVSLRHFAPGAFLLSLGVPLGATWFWGSAWVFSAGFAGAYLLCLVAALAPSIRRNPRLALLLPITVMLMHFAYGFGSLMGALRLPWTWLKPRSRRDGLPSTPVEAVPYSGQRRVQPKDTP